MTTCPGCKAAYTPQEEAALSLWRSPWRQPTLTVWCDAYEHRLAKIYLIGRETLLCLPPIRESQHILGLRRADENPGPVDLHPLLENLDDWMAGVSAGARETETTLRCKQHGTHTVGPGELSNALNYAIGKYGPPSWPWSQGAFLATRL